MNMNLSASESELITESKLSGLYLGLLHSLQIRKKIAHLAEIQKINVSDSELQQAADQMRLSLNLGTRKATLEWLDHNQISPMEFEQMVHDAVLSEKLAQHLFADQVESYFQEHYWDFVDVIFYEILLDDEDLAWDLYYGLQEGELNFHAIAHQYIKDEQQQRLGGYQCLQITQLHPEIKSYLKSTNLPINIKPFMSQNGTHLILLSKIIHPSLDSQMSSNIISKLTKDYINTVTEYGT